MEFDDFLERYRARLVSKTIIGIWIVSLFCFSMFDAFQLGFPPLETLLALAFFASILASIVLTVVATFGIYSYVLPSYRDPLLIKLWIFPVIGSVIWLARRDAWVPS